MCHYLEFPSLLEKFCIGIAKKIAITKNYFLWYFMAFPRINLPFVQYSPLNKYMSGQIENRFVSGWLAAGKLFVQDTCLQV